MPTPFGIRRRIRRLFGRSPAAAAPAVETVLLRVVGPRGDAGEARAPVGSTVLDASSGLKRPIGSGCSDTTCGTCRVEVLEGAENLAESTERERATLQAAGHPATWRLACRAQLRGDVRVRAFELV